MGPTGQTGSTGPTGVGATGPTGNTGPTGPSIPFEGFSVVVKDTGYPPLLSTIINWTIPTANYYTSINLNIGTGIYTVPETGYYSIKATIPIQNTPVTLGSDDINPYFAIVSGSTPILISGFTKQINGVDIIIPYRQTITLTGNLFLTAGDSISLILEATGLVNTTYVGSAGGFFGPPPVSISPGAVWSMRRIY